MSSYYSSSSSSSRMQPLTETRLSATSVARAGELRTRTEDNLRQKREQLAEARRHNSRGQNSVNIQHLENKIRNIEAGLRTGAVDKHQERDVADARKTYEFAKAAENDRLRASLNQRPQAGTRYIAPEIAGQINDNIAAPRIAQHRDNIRREYRQEQIRRH